MRKHEGTGRRGPGLGRTREKLGGARRPIDRRTKFGGTGLRGSGMGRKREWEPGGRETGGQSFKEQDVEAQV